MTILTPPNSNGWIVFLMIYLIVTVYFLKKAHAINQEEPLHGLRYIGFMATVGIFWPVILLAVVFMNIISLIKYALSGEMKYD